MPVTSCFLLFQKRRMHRSLVRVIGFNLVFGCYRQTQTVLNWDCKSHFPSIEIFASEHFFPESKDVSGSDHFLWKKKLFQWSLYFFFYLPSSSNIFFLKNFFAAFDISFFFLLKKKFCYNFLSVVLFTSTWPF